MGGLTLAGVGLFLMSRLNQESTLAFVMLALVIHGGGIGIFGPPNNRSILSAVKRSRYGVVSGFLNLVRNSGNVIGVAITTVIVTGVMASKGFPPSLSTVSETGDSELLSAFAAGMRTAYLWMSVKVAVGVALCFAKGGTPPTDSAAESRFLGDDRQTSPDEDRGA